MRRTLKVYILGITTVAALAVLLALLFAPPVFSRRAVVLALLLVGLSALTYLAPLPLAPKRRLIFDTAVHTVALLVLSPGAAAVLSALGTALGNCYLRRRWFNTLFNAAQVAVRVVAAAVTYRLLTPVSLADPGHTLRSAATLIPAGVALYLVSALAVDGAAAIQRRSSPFDNWLAVHGPAIAPHGTLVAIGAVTATAMSQTPWAILVAAVPVAAILTMTRTALQFDAGATRIAEEISEAVEASHPVLIGKARRMSALAWATAEACDSPGADCRRVALAARLHDLAVVLRPEHDNHQSHLRDHPQDDAAYVERVFRLGDVADVLRFHHERFDGRGHPRGLIGKDIPMQSRVLAICHAWVALTSEAGDRPALSEQQALTVLRAGAGTQWDPDLIEPLRRALQSLGQASAPPATMAGPAAPLQLSPLTAVLQRLGHARAHASWIRVVLWGWCAALFVWLAPFGWWSATELPPSLALLIGGVVLAGGAALVLLQRAVSRTDAIDAVLGQMKHRHNQGQEGALSIQALPQGRLGIAPTRPATSSPRGEPFRSLMQQTAELVMVLDADGTGQSFSPSAAHVLGYQPEELAGISLFALAHPDDTARVLSFHLACLGNRGITEPITFRCRARNGSWRSFESTFSNLLADPGVGGVVVISRDITERERLEAMLSRQAFSDALTGLPNRLLFLDRLEHALARARQHNRPVTVMFLDVDRFKQVNDRFGHGAGDALLVAAAGRLAAALRPSDTLARLGGDEFTVLIEDLCHPSEALGLAERLLDAVRQPFTIDGRELNVTVSIGIACAPAVGIDLADLLRDADAAMYRAKAAGRGRAVVAGFGIGARTAAQLGLEMDLQYALQRDELRLHYQPEVDLRTGAVVGMEALVRWEHPRRGLVTPAEFIPLAEESDLIIRIGQWVLEEACRQARSWQAHHAGGPPLVVSVNLSALQFQQSNLVAQVARILRETGVAPAGLRLEITESVVMQRTEHTVETLRALQELGVGLALDDFGTGYSSLSYLPWFPVDTLKLDPSFVHRVDSDEKMLVVLQAITALAHRLGMTVTAEGIESAAQWSCMRASQCDRGQGEYFAPALAPEALRSILGTGRPLGQTLA